MADFFASMNFTRGVILVTLLGSAVLGWLVWSSGKAFEQLDRERSALAPKVVSEIQELSLAYDNLERQLSRDEFQKQANPISYIQSVAGEQDVSLGQVDVDPQSKPIGGGVVDNKFTITPAERDRGYARTNIANFLYRLEEKSLKVKVTNLRLYPASASRQQPQEVLDDSWTFTATVTSREAEDG